VAVFDAGRIEAGPFYVEMAVCADPDEDSPGSIRIGRSLREAQPGLGSAEAARLVEDLARAVHAAHHGRHPRRCEAENVRSRPRHAA
jgi:hypothetical protein